MCGSFWETEINKSIFEIFEGELQTYLIRLMRLNWGLVKLNYKDNNFNNIVPSLRRKRNQEALRAQNMECPAEESNRLLL